MKRVGGAAGVGSWGHSGQSCGLSLPALGPLGRVGQAGDRPRALDLRPVVPHGPTVGVSWWETVYSGTQSFTSEDPKRKGSFFWGLTCDQMGSKFS